MTRPDTVYSREAKLGTSSLTEINNEIVKLSDLLARINIVHLIVDNLSGPYCGQLVVFNYEQRIS